MYVLLKNVVRYLQKMQHQDWNPVVFRKTPSNAGVTPSSVVSEETAKYRRLMNDEEPVAKKSTIEDRAWIIEGRQAKKWTQKELACKANVQVDIIKNLENGKNVPNGSLKHKLKRLFQS